MQAFIPAFLGGIYGMENLPMSLVLIKRMCYIFTRTHI